MSARTIAAIATPIGSGAIAIVRLSGPDAWRIARCLCTGLPAACTGPSAWVRTVRHDGQILDRAVLVAFAAPRSVTGDDVVELQVHGGPATATRVLDAVIELGAHAAEPGAFTRRALENGRLDLVQAEAVADVIHARSEAAQRLAQQHLSGRLSAHVDRIKAQLFDVVVLVEAAIDFALEEHVYSISADEIAERLEPIRRALDELLAGWDAGRMRTEGIRVAIVGAPNAGKSSLLNLLVGHDRALVTEIAGTTRDTVEESVQIDGVEYRLIDTAGIRQTDDRVEKLGIERSHRAANAADILVHVIDSASPVEPLSMESALPARVLVRLFNKSDLAEASFVGDGAFEAAISIVGSSDNRAVIDLLRTAAARAGLANDEDSPLLSRARHRDCVWSARSSLETALAAARDGLGHELVALDLRAALTALGELTGAVTSDDVLARVFADFCVGK